MLASFAYKAGWETQKTLIAGGSERKTALFSPVRAPMTNTRRYEGYTIKFLGTKDAGLITIRGDGYVEDGFSNRFPANQ